MRYFEVGDYRNFKKGNIRSYRQLQIIFSSLFGQIWWFFKLDSKAMEISKGNWKLATKYMSAVFDQVSWFYKLVNIANFKTVK